MRFRLYLPISFPILITVLVLGLAACTSFPTSVPPVENPSATILPASLTPTSTSLPTITPTSSPTLLPSPTPTATTPPFDLANINQMAGLAQVGEGTLGQVVVSPDGQTLAVAGSQGIWLLDKFKLETIGHITGHAGEVSSVSWSPDGTRLASGGDDGSVRVWDVRGLLEGTDTFQQVHLLIAHTGRITAVSWSSNPSLLASAGEEGNVWIWEFSITQQGEDDARALRQLAHASAVYALAWHPGGRFLATASLDSTLDLWDATPGLNLATLEGHESWATTIAWNPMGDVLASGATDRTLRLWNVTFTVPSNPNAPSSARIQPRTIIQTLYNPNVVSWTPDGSQVISAGGSPFAINFWDPAPTENLEEVELREALRTFNGHFAAINGLAFGPGGVLISTAADTTLRIWNLSTGQEIRRLSPQGDPITPQPFTAPIQALTWSPDGEQLATGHADYLIRIWDATAITLQQTLVLTGHQNVINSIDWSTNGNWIATGSNDNTTRVWDAHTGQLLQTLNSEGGRVSAVAFAPFGNQVASGGLFRIAQIWEVGTDQPPVLLFSDTEIAQLAWAPSGTLLAMGGNDGTITVWDVPAATQILLLSGEHANSISGMAWSPDGTRLATLDTGGKTVIWDTANGLPVSENLINGIRRAGLSWSPNGQLIASADSTRIYILDANTGNPLRLLTGHTGEIRSVEWKPDGGQLASGGVDGSVHLWGIAPDSSAQNSQEGLEPSTQWPAPVKTTTAAISLENAGDITQLGLIGRGTALHLDAHPSGQYMAIAGGIGTWVYDTEIWEPLRLLPGSKTYAAVWSPNGKFLAVRELSSVLVWDVQREQLIRVFGMDIGVLPHLAWSPDSTMLAAGNFRGVVRVYNLATGEILREWQPGRDITSLAWSPNGRTLAAGGTAPETDLGMVWLWDIPTGDLLNRISGHSARVTHLAWSPDGTSLLSAGDDRAITHWDVTMLTPPPEPAEGEDIEFSPIVSQTLTAEAMTSIESLMWNADGSLFMTGDASGTVYFWGAESGLIQSSLSTSSMGLVSAVWIPETEFIVTTGSDGKVSGWNLTTGENFVSIPSHTAEVRLSSWTVAGDSLFIGGVDGTLQQIQLNGDVLQTKYLGYSASTIAYFVNTGLTAVRGSDGALEVFQIGSENPGRPIDQGRGEPATEWHIDWSQDGVYLAWNQTTAETTTIEVLGISTNERFSLNGAVTKITALSWSPDLTTEDAPSRGGSLTFRLGAGTEDGNVLIWEVASERLLRTIQAYSGRVRVIAWSPEGRYFATGGSDGQDNEGYQYVRIWDSSTGRMIHELELPFGHEALSLVWSPDGTILASGDSFGDVLLWNPTNGELVGSLRGHKQAVISLDWSRVNNAIVSGSRDGTVRVWGIVNE